MTFKFGFWRQQQLLEEWLPWITTLGAEQRIVLTRVGGLLCVARFDAPDFETASAEELTHHMDRLASAFARLDSGWSVWIDQWRTETRSYLPACDFGGNYAAQRIDQARARAFTDAGRPVFQNTAFLAIHYIPQSRDALLHWLMDRQSPQVEETIRYFTDTSDSLLKQLAFTFRSIESLCGDPLGSYLAATVSYRPKKTFLPTGVIAQKLAACEWITDSPLQIDQRYLTTVEVRNFGSPSPLACEGLHQVPFPLRWTVAFHAMDPDKRRAELRELRKRWQQKQLGPGAILTNLFTRNPFAGRTNPEATRNLDVLDMIEGELHDHPFALAHANVHCPGDTAEQSLDRAEFVAAQLNASGFIARVATLNNVFAPMGDMPGNVGQHIRNVRRAREELGAIVRVAPLTGVSPGDDYDWRFGGPALLMAKTRRSIPYSFAMNEPGSDVAHTGIIGQTGAGKSALISFMVAQFMRYGESRAVVFDRKRSFMVACLALGGDWIELGGDGVGVQPLRYVHDRAEFAWAHDWIIKALLTQNYEVKAHTKAAITDALQHVAETPDPDERTLTLFCNLMGGDEHARQALRTFLHGGPYGGLFDGVVSSYGEARVLGVETGAIMQLEAAAPLAISAMFRAVQYQRLVGPMPKLVIVDEAWSLLQSKLFAGEIESWAREMRKLMAALVLATQSLEDLANPGTQVIFDQLATRFYLPHPEAERPGSAMLYKKAGLQDEQIRALAGATKKREYLLQRSDVTRLVDIHLEDEALQLCGASSPLDHERARALLADGIEPGQQFAEAWLAETTNEWHRKRLYPPLAIAAE